VIEDLQAGTQTVLYDQNGAGGHSDLGYGTMVAVDNWNNYANAWRLWDLASPMTGGGSTTTAGVAQGGLVYHNLNWGAFNPRISASRTRTTPRHHPAVRLRWRGEQRPHAAVERHRLLPAEPGDRRGG